MTIMPFLSQRRPDHRVREKLTEKKQNVVETESKKTEDKKPVIVEQEDKAEEETEHDLMNEETAI